MYVICFMSSILLVSICICKTSKSLAFEKWVILKDSVKLLDDYTLFLVEFLRQDCDFLVFAEMTLVLFRVTSC